MIFFLEFSRLSGLKYVGYTRGGGFFFENPYRSSSTKKVKNSYFGFSSNFPKKYTFLQDFLGFVPLYCHLPDYPIFPSPPLHPIPPRYGKTLRKQYAFY